MGYVLGVLLGVLLGSTFEGTFGSLFFVGGTFGGYFWEVLFGCTFWKYFFGVPKVKILVKKLFDLKLHLWEANLFFCAQHGTYKS